MITVKCIQKFRDKQNKIYGYRIQDQQGNTRDIKSEALKKAIINKQINIINLKLTSDYRLVDKDVKVSKQSTLEEKVKAALVKAAFIGASTPEALYELACQEGFQDIIELSEADCKGDKVKLNTHFKNYKDALQHPEATIFITNMRGMFKGCKEEVLDISNFNTSNVTDMSGMFEGCGAKTLDLSSFNTSNVTNMIGIFRCCQAQTLDISSFNTSKVTSMVSMFNGCQAQILDLKSFDTSNVTDMYHMFFNCKVQNLDLSSFNTSNVTDMSSMFMDCKAQTIDISSFNTSNVISMMCMFSKCQAKIIDLSSFNTSNVNNMLDMFYRCKAKIKATDPKILEEYKYRGVYG